jgi:hypothetical protein
MTKTATVFAVTVVTLGIVVCLLALNASSAGAVTRCEKLDSRYIKARDIRTFGGLGCVRARLLVARYLANITVGGLCRDDRFTSGGCAVTRFDCATRRPPGGGDELAGRCQTLNGRRVVRFLEYDDLPPPNPNGLTG